jgi:hypothetical protein
MGFGWFLIIAPAAWALAYLICGLGDWAYANADARQAHTDKYYHTAD